MPFPISVVNACLRDGRGGSPTAVVDESAPATGPRPGASPAGTALPRAAPTDAERSQVPVRFGTSHAVFVRRRDPLGAPGARRQHEIRAAAGESTLDLRFFTAEGELPACGHGTIAAVALAAERCRDAEQEFSASGRTFTGRATRDGDRVHAAFDPGPVTLRDPISTEIDPVVAALGVTPDLLTVGACVASLGRARMLVPVATPGAVAASPTGPVILVGGVATVTRTGTR